MHASRRMEGSKERSDRKKNEVLIYECIETHEYSTNKLNTEVH